MNVFKTKLKALTLIDAMVGMIISAMTVAFAITGYQVIYKQFYDYKRMNKVTVDLTQFNSVFKNDFFNAFLIKKNNNGIDIDLPVKYGQEFSNALYENQISYQFNQQYVIRKLNNHPDTFFVSCTNPIAQFLNHEQMQNSGLVDELTFDVALFGKNESLHFQKQYAADLLMRTEAEPGQLFLNTFDNK